jgi:Ubiquitin-2 like Rad60 SUMO-like
VTIRACSSIQVLVYGYDGSVRAVRVLSDDTVNTLKNRYNIKHRGKQTSMWAQQYQRFSFGDRQLQDEDRLCEVGITDGDTVKEARGGLLGGFAKQGMAVQPTKGLSESFADISQPGEVVQWAEHGPEWLQCAAGLCLEGVCTNTTCEASYKTVIMNYGFMDFDLLRDNCSHNLELVCPMCDEFVKATTCGMNRCLWRMTGVKAGSNLTISTPWETVGNYYYSFTEQPSVEWTRLLIQVYTTLLLKYIVVSG